MLTESKRLLQNYAKSNKLPYLWRNKQVNKRKFRLMTEEVLGAIKKCLDESKNVVVVSHVRPDGDAIGSLLGLGLALIDAGKTVQMVLVDGIPASYRHLQ